MQTEADAGLYPQNVVTARLMGVDKVTATSRYVLITPEGSLLVSAQAASFVNLSGAGTTVIKNGAGVLRSVIVNNAASNSTITIYDNTAGSGAKIATITNPLALLNNQYVLPYGLAFTVGLTVVITGSNDITVVYA